MWRIFVPLQYWLINHPEKRKFDIWLPAAFALLFCLPLLSENFRYDMINSRIDLLSRVSSLLGVLVGFFIAALAAVATFGKAEMDQPMAGEPPLRLEHRANGETFFENLSRRRFLAFLFGYLSLVTLALYVFSFVFELLKSIVL